MAHIFVGRPRNCLQSSAQCHKINAYSLPVICFTVSVIEDGGSGSPSTLSPEGVDLGSGVATTQPLLEPSATPVITSRNSQLSQWLTSSASWKNDYVQWESFARSESGLQLPDSTVCDIVNRFNNSLRASDVRQNSAAWFSLLTNWRQGYDTYNGTFHGLCPNL